MKNKLFIIVITIAMVIGIYFSVKKSPVQAPTIQEKEQTQSPSSENIASEQSSSDEEISQSIVNYTESGFSPSVIEIKKGETVRFVNQSIGGMWIGSGPHPTHTAYPEFDAKKSVPNGGIYEFTFNKVGSWSYHNHTGPGKAGMVIVK